MMQSIYTEYSHCNKYEDDPRLYIKHSDTVSHSCLGRSFSEFIEQTASLSNLYLRNFTTS